jgi:prevent-host-death family protein
MKTIQASKVRQTFAKVLETVRRSGEGVIIVRYGAPVAALVPVDHRAAQNHEHRLRGAARDAAKDR